NRAGREGKGVVRPGEVDQVLRVLTQALERFTDPATSARPIKKIHLARELYRGKEHPHMPDALVGYARGYRASWETALGAVPNSTVEPNRKKWSGDHCVDASEVPGVCLSSDRGLDAATLAGLGEAIDRHLAARLAAAPGVAP